MPYSNNEPIPANSSLPSLASNSSHNEDRSDVIRIKMLSQVSIQEGPRFKGKATLDLEKLAHILLSQDGYSLVYYSVNQFNELWAYMKEGVFNITDIFRHEPDFEHIQLSQSRLKCYVQFTDVLHEKGYFKDNNWRLGNFKLSNCSKQFLSRGELLAIRFYTSQYFSEIQGLLRGDKDWLNQKKTEGINPFFMTQLLLSSVIIGYAFSSHLEDWEKLNETNILYRWEASTPHIQRYLGSDIKPALSAVQGFFSTSKKDYSSKKNSNLIWISQPGNAPNTLGKRIDFLSLYPNEEERLFLPYTQFLFELISTDEGNCQILAVPVRSIENIKDYSDLARVQTLLENLERILGDLLSMGTHNKKELIMIAQNLIKNFNKKFEENTDPLEEEAITYSFGTMMPDLVRSLDKNITHNLVNIWHGFASLWVEKNYPSELRRNIRPCAKVYFKGRDRIN